MISDRTTWPVTAGANIARRTSTTWPRKVPVSHVPILYFSPYLLTSTELDDFFDAADRLGPSARVSRRRVCVGVDFFRVCVALSPAPGVDFLKGGDQDHWDDLQNQN